MNCVNCGAPPRRGAKECVYCETLLSVKEPRANQAGFQWVMRAVNAFDFDGDRLMAVRSLRGRFTAGQVIRIMEAFDFDSDRLDAGRHLVPLTLNPGMLYEAAGLFDFDSDRAGFVQLLGSVTYVGDGEIEEEPPSAPWQVWVASTVRRPLPWGWIALTALGIATILKEC